MKTDMKEAGLDREQLLRQKLEAGLQPVYMQLDDESGMHSVAQGAQSHFRLAVASAHFQGLSRIARHKLVYSLLGEEFNRGLHALTVQAFTPEEWQGNSNDSLRDSPDCLGGGSKTNQANQANQTKQAKRADREAS